MVIISNKAKVSRIHKAVQPYGPEAGKRSIFLSFTNTNRDIVDDTCLLPVAVDILTAADIIKNLWQNHPHTCLHFCGAEPLRRFDWIKRLHTKLPEIDFVLSTRSTDSRLLAELLHIVKQIELKITLNGCYENSRELQIFIQLASVRKIWLNIDIAEISIPDFTVFIENLMQTDINLPVYLKSKSLAPEEFLMYHNIASNYLENAFAINNEVDNENTY